MLRILFVTARNCFCHFVISKYKVTWTQQYVEVQYIKQMKSKVLEGAERLLTAPEISSISWLQFIERLGDNVLNGSICIKWLPCRGQRAEKPHLDLFLSFSVPLRRPRSQVCLSSLRSPDWNSSPLSFTWNRRCSLFKALQDVHLITPSCSDLRLRRRYEQLSIRSLFHDLWTLTVCLSVLIYTCFTLIFMVDMQLEEWVSFTVSVRLKNVSL